MADPRQRLRYEAIGRFMTGESRAGGGGRRAAWQRGNARVDRAVRVTRDRRRRGGLPWNDATRRAARDEAARGAASPLARAWAQQAEAAKLEAATRRERRAREMSTLGTRGRAGTGEVDALFPSQASFFCRSGPAVTGPDGGRVRAWAWAPPVAARAKRVMLTRPGGLPTGALLEWEGLHSTITAGRPAAGFTEAQREAAASQAAGQAVTSQLEGTSPEAPTTGAMVVGLTHACSTWAGLIPQGRGVKVTDLPRAVRMSEGWTVLRCVLSGAAAREPDPGQAVTAPTWRSPDPARRGSPGGLGEGLSEEAFWFHVSHVYFRPLRPTLLRLRLVGGGEEGSGAVLEPMRVAGGAAYWWETATAAASGMATVAARASILRVEFWDLSEADVTDSAGQVLRHRVRARRLGSVDSAWRSGMDWREAARAVGGGGEEEECSDVEEPARRPARREGGAGGDRPPAGGGRAGGEGAGGPGGPPPHPPAPPEAPATSEKVTRARRGVRRVVHGGPHGHAFETLFTWRRPGAGKPHGGYQATCYHHEAEESVGRSGRSTKLRCVKELPCEEAGDDDRVVALLEAWVCAAEGHATRRAHMASLDRRASQADLASQRRGGGAGGDRPPGAPSGSSCSSSSPSASEASSSSPSASEGEGSAGEGDGPCWVCGLPHRVEECHVWRSAVAASLEDAPAMAVGRVWGENGVRLDKAMVQTRDVPSDGNCLFHALQRELLLMAGVLRPGMSRGEDGQALREWMLEYVRTSSDTVAGRPLQEWLEVAPEQYFREMRAAAAGDRRTWGGFLEGMFVSRGLGVSIVLLTARPDGYHVSAWTEPSERVRARVACAAWTGTHWVRARLTESGWERLCESEGT